VRPIEEAPGVYRLPLFTPFPVKPTNAYVLVGDRVVLFDTGVNHARTWDDLEEGLADLGLTPDDVDTVFLSHAHVDHTGLGHRFDHARVLMGRRDQPKMLDFPGHLHGLADAVGRRVTAWGVPPELAQVLRAPVTALLDMSLSVPWVAPVGSGLVVEGVGAPFRVIELSGHTEGGIALYREHDGVLVVGDHILEDITPNPGVIASHDPVTSGLPDYMASLSTLEEIEVSVVLPGHGRSFPGLRERIAVIRAHHQDRLDEVERACGDGHTLFAVMAAMFPQMDPLNGFLALSEVFGHVEVLEQTGRIQADVDASGTILYRRDRTSVLGEG
jgi:glyoxylase-like metal-dependent hydrolase (beta-lactamase superfamily II)